MNYKDAALFSRLTRVLVEMGLLRPRVDVHVHDSLSLRRSYLCTGNMTAERYGTCSCITIASLSPAGEVVVYLMFSGRLPATPGEPATAYTLELDET